MLRAKKIYQMSTSVEQNKTPVSTFIMEKSLGWVY